MHKILLFILSLFVIAAAKPATQPLPPEQAFVFTANMEKSSVLSLEWKLAPRVYLYRDKFKITGTPAVKATGWPKAEQKSGVWVYENAVKATIPLSKAQDYTIKVKYQGCSHDGYCYPPMEKTLKLSFPFSQQGLNEAPLLTIQDARMQPPPVKLTEGLLTDQAATQAFMGSHTWVITLLCFLGLGLLLAFTPCSLPMIPILSSIIVGQHQKGSKKAFALSLAYVLGVALTYAIAGVAIAWLGSSVQASLQNVWVIATFSVLFLILGGAMFGWFDLRLPASMQQKMLSWQQRQSSGSYVGVFLMGALSTLVVSPCVTAPLVGVLAYISETGSVWLGGSALFALGLGMGVPLLLIGFSADKVLPRSGAWMEAIKKIFGFMLIGMAIWMISRVIPEGMALFLWAALFMSAAIYCFFFTETFSTRARRNLYVMGSVLMAYGFALFVGVALDYTSPLYPFEKLASHEMATTLPFVEVKDMNQLNQLLQEAKASKKPVVLDFYAEWCESCRALEKAVLAKPEVQAVLQSFVLLRANVTENNEFDNALLKRYSVVAPPTFIFFDNKGQELADRRIVGEVGQKLFLARASNIAD